MLYRIAYRKFDGTFSQLMLLSSNQAGYAQLHKYDKHAVEYFSLAPKFICALFLLVFSLYSLSNFWSLCIFFKNVMRILQHAVFCVWFLSRSTELWRFIVFYSIHSFPLLLMFHAVCEAQFVCSPADAQFLDWAHINNIKDMCILIFE